MSKAERYIELVSDENGHLCDQHALKAVEIAREEMIERALITFQVVCNRPAKLLPNCESYCNACKQFKQAMEDE